MGAHQDTAEKKQYFKLIAKAENTDPDSNRAICKQEKVGENYTVTGWYTSVTGFLTDIKIKEVEWNGQKNKIVALELTDKDGVCQLEFSFSKASFSIINSLLGADLIQEIRISAWTKEADNGKVFVNANVKYLNNEKAEWVIAPADQPAPIEYTTPGGKQEKDYTNVKSFWEGKLMEVKPRALKSNFNGTMGEPSAPKPLKNNENFDKERTVQQTPNTGLEEEESDLPF